MTTARQLKIRRRALEKYRRVTPSGCWEWTGSILASNGYGQYRVTETNLLVHRMSYEFLVGPIPNGHDVHHACENRLCFNPEHLVALARPDHFQQHRKTHCVHGHAFDERNTYISKDGYRCCRRCHADSMARRRAKARVSVPIGSAA